LVEDLVLALDEIRPAICPRPTRPWIEAKGAELGIALLVLGPERFQRGLRLIRGVLAEYEA
jgi:hypothetical protein